MSYSLGAVYNNASWAMSNQSSILSRLQEKAATGQEINRPSDDPYDSSHILNLRTETRSLDRYIDTVTDVESKLDFSASVVQEMTGENGLLDAWQ